MSETIWWTGVAVWTGGAACVLWLLLATAAEAFDATWFTARCVLEGGTKNQTLGNLRRIWFACFMGRIASVQAAEGYRIVYPGYGKSEDGDYEERWPG